MIRDNLLKLPSLLSLIALGILITSCNCSTPVTVAPLQKSDKKLACKDIILEINEAEHYRSLGEKGKYITAGEALMPTCWIAGYMDGSEAVKASTARIEYLKNIYDLLDCSGSKSTGASGSKSGFNASIPKDFVPLPVTEKKAKPLKSSKSSKLAPAPVVPAVKTGSGSDDEEDDDLLKMK